MLKFVYRYTLVILLSMVSLVHAAPQVLVSIKPLYGIFAYLMDGVAAPEVLLPDNASPHHYLLKPSDRLKLSQADLIVLIDPQLETFINMGGTDTPYLVASQLPDTQTLLKRTTKSAPSTQKDLHLWLSPDNAKTIAKAGLLRLAEIDPQNALIYRQNYLEFVSSLEDTQVEIQALVDQAPVLPVMVYHDAYQYFEQRFGLPPAFVFQRQPGIPIGPKHFLSLKQNLSDRQVKCMLIEPEFDTDKLTVFADEHGLQISVADPLGSQISLSKMHYHHLLQSLGKAMAQCES